jgi:Crossover junction endodeoxyribonuclease RuvC
VKASVAGHGHADKRQMQMMVRALLSMTEIPEPSDAADALAVALCHLQAEQSRRRFNLPVVNSTVERRLPRAAGIPVDQAGNIASSGTSRGILPRIVSTR